MQDDIPMPPSHGCIVFHTPNEPKRIRWPMPNSIRNNGMPSNISITKNGIKNAPATKQRRKKNTIEKPTTNEAISFRNNGIGGQLRKENQWTEERIRGKAHNMYDLHRKSMATIKQQIGWLYCHYFIFLDWKTLPLDRRLQYVEKMLLCKNTNINWPKIDRFLSYCFVGFRALRLAISHEELTLNSETITVIQCVWCYQLA